MNVCHILRQSLQIVADIHCIFYELRGNELWQASIRENGISSVLAYDLRSMVLPFLLDSCTILRVTCWRDRSVPLVKPPRPVTSSLNPTPKPRNNKDHLPNLSASRPEGEKIGVTDGRNVDISVFMYKCPFETTQEIEL